MWSGGFTRLKVVIALSIFGILIVYFFAQLVVGVVFFILKHASILGDEEFVSQEYHHFQLNPETNETSVGFVKIPQSLRNEEYLSYRDDFGNYNLLSNFGAKRFKCRGPCYCDQEDESRRGSVLSLSRELTYLLVAATTFVAYEIAQHVFHNLCRIELKEGCPDDKIMSYPDECEEIEIEGKKKGVFFCKGNCLPREFLGDDEAKERAEKFECEKIIYEGEVEVELENQKMILESFDDAKLKFQELYMNVQCEQASKKERTYMASDPDGKEYPIYEGFEYLCRGRPYELDINPSIHCIIQGY